MKTLRPIAIYLPQFHPIPENDAWWGKGFTEWHNVVRAKPRYRGHYQPQLPADLGYYDLRLPEVREQQAKLAAEYGIHGFCYYHYWFEGRRILERPFQEIFESGKPDFPFMLAWANGSWNRGWDGSETSLLIKQTYSEEDHFAHIKALIPYFKDPRYIRIKGRPVFAVYMDDQIPDFSRMIEIFRQVGREEGLELYLCRFDRNFGTKFGDPTLTGLDAALEFQPLAKSLSEYNAKRPPEKSIKLFRRVRRRFLANFRNSLGLGAYVPKKKGADFVVDLEKFVAFDIARKPETYKCFPGVSPGFDNTSRRDGLSATIFKNSTPLLFQKWVEGKARKFVPYSEDENLFFINAWNEWAEGNHLEPCQKYGHQWLEALRDGLASTNNQLPRP